MTSIPASRSAAATTLAPRSWPSSPGFATRTRTGRLVAGRAISGGTAAAPPGRPRPCGPLVVDDVHLHPLRERVFHRVVDPRVVVLAVGEQGAHLPALQRLERRLHPVDRPAAPASFRHGLGVGALPGALALLPEHQRSLPD